MHFVLGFLFLFVCVYGKLSETSQQAHIAVLCSNTSHRGENTDLPCLNFYQIAYNRLLFALSFFWHTANICHSANL